MSIRQGKGNHAPESLVTEELQRRRMMATNGVRWAVREIERREKYGHRMAAHQELALMAAAFIAGARGSKDGKIPRSDADRAANELLDTGRVSELGVQLVVRLVDGITGPGDSGGWAIGYVDHPEANRPLVVMP